MPEAASLAVKSAFRVLDILELLAGEPMPVPHARIAAALGIPKSSLTSLLRTLLERGYVEMADGAYRPGPRVADLASTGKRRAGAAEVARPVVTHLRDMVGESAGFSVLDGDAARVVAAANADHPLTYVVRIGNLLPLHATSPGKVILAGMAEPDLSAWLARVELAAFTPRTVCDAAALRRDLRIVQRDGFALSTEERHPGIVGLAVPVLDREGEVAGALNVALPVARFAPAVHARILAALREAAADLGRRLAGGRGRRG